jgi:hypothetical protein
MTAHQYYNQEIGTTKRARQVSVDDVEPTQKKKSKRWTADEDALLLSWKGSVKSICDALPHRNYMSVRSRLSAIGGTSTHVSWTYDEDTLMRSVPRGGSGQNTMRAYFEEHFPDRTYFSCAQRFKCYIAPLIGMPRPAGVILKTKFENHVKLSRSDDEMRCLRSYYNLS